MANSSSAQVRYSDVTLIGAGIMSATLATFLRELAPHKSISVFERLPTVAAESSNEWNNAGTGHSALCELNYTEEKADGSVAIDRAINIYEQFQLSLQFWSYLTSTGKLENPKDFINQLPHMSFVQGDKNVEFLRKRVDALTQHHFFKGMEFSESPEQLAQWIPLMMRDRQGSERLAATHIDRGTDVNFGELTRKLFEYLEHDNVDVCLRHSVQDVKRLPGGDWELKILDSSQNSIFKHRTKFVFIGCGGGSLHLLQKSGIPESKHIGGFPVSGLFLVCRNPDVVSQHFAKVYGKAKLGSPPMSVPHLDTRFIEGKQSLLFGPFAGFTSKFLKEGSHLDMMKSFTLDNFSTMISAGMKNMPLTKYLIKQAMLSKAERMQDLREFLPTARDEDWELLVAGQRVQIIKDVNGEKGVLCFGTEVVSGADGSLSALLGASPGASTSVKAMLDVLAKCFVNEMPEWQAKIKEMIPSYGKSLHNDPELYEEIKKHISVGLGLNFD